MATVWRAYDLVLNRAVAVKMPIAELADDTSLTDAVLTEARAAARLSHPHLAAVHDYGEDSNGDGPQPYVVMELVEGHTLAARVAEDGPLDWTEAVTIGAQIADALTAVHDAGLVHRDVKPGNIMLAAAGPKLVDFGVAAPTGRSPADAAGRIWGTPGYLPPEQLLHGHAVPAGDVFALGVLLYECLAGRPPWQATGIDALLTEQRRVPVPALPQPTGLPPEIEPLYRRCLSATASERPAASEVARVLRQAIPAGASLRPAATTTPDAPATRPHRHRYSRRVLAMVVAPAAVLAGAIGAQLSAPPADETAQAGPMSGGQAVITAACAADYSSQRHADGSFAARLVMSHTGTQPLPRWSTQFTVPEGHRVTGVTGADWSQRANQVTVTGGRALAPGTAAGLSLKGTFDRTDGTAPSGFTLNGVECERAVTRVRSSSTPTALTAANRDRPPTRTQTRAPRTKEPATPDTATPASPSAMPTTSEPPTGSPSPPASPPQPSVEPSSEPSATTDEPSTSPTGTAAPDPSPSSHDGLPSPDRTAAATSSV
jgi:serine/threonine-protein kinase